jgi:amino acid transporter
MITIPTKLPRNVNKWRAAAILYGDWGTSKAYVLGLAFAMAGYSSFWYILAVSILTFLVGINYIKICSFYPHGGGVYESVKNRSKALSLVGALFLISDYLVTAALSALSAFNYLGVSHPGKWAIASIGIIGVLNFFGPKHSGSVSIALAVPTVCIVLLLGFLSLFFMDSAVHLLKPVSHSIKTDWTIFVSIIIALSGIEAIANTTGSMELDSGSSDSKPSVVKTARPAIIMVMLEVCIFTALLGLAMNALPGIHSQDGTLAAPGYDNVRDAMLRYMGESFSATLFNAHIGSIFSWIISIVITFLLLSAVNTAIIALISLLFAMARDEEIPFFFQKLNFMGVPFYSTAIAFIVPMLILCVIDDIAGLANLYAIGFVGAIAVNLGSTSTNLALPMSQRARAFMFFTFLIMLAIESTLFIDKPEARSFVFAVLGIGLLLRSLVQERKEKMAIPIKAMHDLPKMAPHQEGGILVAVTGINKALNFSLEEAENLQKPLHLLFIREQKYVSERERSRLWTDDPAACALFDYTLEHTQNRNLEFLYAVTNNPLSTVSELARQKKVSRVVISRKRGASQTILHMLRGSTIRQIVHQLPKSIDLVVIY